MKFKTDFARREIKFLITLEQQREILEFLEQKIRQDKWGKSTVSSLYYDTDSHLLIRRSLQHPIYKEKFRIRCYGEKSEHYFAEIKKKYKGIVYKRRSVLNFEEMERFLDNKLQMEESPTQREIEFFFKRYEKLTPKMLIMCEREAYFDKKDSGFRITFDRNIRYRDYDLSLGKGIYGERLLPENKVLMEIKADTALPLYICKMLTSRQMYKISFSKYGRAYLKTRRGLL